MITLLTHDEQPPLIFEEKLNYIQTKLNNLKTYNMENTTELITMSIKQYAQENSITQIAPVVRTNTNGYPYLTMISNDNVATNVYFSRNAAVGVTAGTPVSKEMLSVYQIGITHNEAGEERIKLVSNSARIDIAGLLD